MCKNAFLVYFIDDTMAIFVIILTDNSFLETTPLCTGGIFFAYSKKSLPVIL